MESGADPIALLVVNHEYWSQEIDLGVRQDEPTVRGNRRVCKDCGEQNRKQKVHVAAARNSRTNELTGCFGDQRLAYARHTFTCDRARSHQTSWPRSSVSRVSTRARGELSRALLKVVPSFCAPLKAQMLVVRLRLFAERLRDATKNRFEQERVYENVCAVLFKLSTVRDCLYLPRWHPSIVSRLDAHLVLSLRVVPCSRPSD